MSAEQDRRKDFEESYNHAWAAWGAWQSQARGDLTAVTKSAWTARDIAYMKKVMGDREIMSFNRLRPLIRFVGNFERQNRLSVKYEPAEGSDAPTGSQLTMVANFALAHNHGYHVKSECFDSSLKSGMTLFNMGIDRNAEIVFDKFGYNQFILHPGFTKRDLSDCQYGILRKDVTPSEAKMFFPDSEDLVDGLMKKEPNEDGKFAHKARMRLYGKYLLTLDEWTRRTTARKKYLIDARTGHVLDAAGNKVEYKDTPMERMIRVSTPTLDLIEEWERTVEVTQYLNGVEVYHGVDPWGIGDFSFTPFICFFDPEVEEFEWRIQGLARGLKDAQRTFDRRTIANIRAIECTVGSGLDVEEDTLVDDEQAYLAGPGHPRFFREGAISGNRFRDRPAPNLPAGWLEMQASFEQLMGKMLNLDVDGMMGVNQKDQLVLGVVGKMRLGLGMVGMFDLFDNASLAHQVIGGKLLRLIQHLPPERAARILGKPPAPAFFSKEFGKYDAIPCETPVTDSQRSEAYAAMMGINQQYAQLQQPMPFAFEDILEYMPITLRDEIIQRIRMRQQQQAEAQQRMAQVQQGMQEAAIRQLQADTLNEQVHVRERVANAENKAAQTVKTKMETAQIAQEMQVGPQMDAVDRLIEMEKINVQKQIGMAKKEGAGTK